MAFSSNSFSFGQVIPVLGPNVGYTGNVSRMGNQRTIRSRPVLATTANPISFGAGVVELSYNTGSTQPGGAYQSFADFLATATNAQYLPFYFAGIAVRNVKTMYQYTALNQSTNTTSYSTTTSGSTTAGATTFAVASATNLAVGQYIEGYGWPAGTIVTAISGTTITPSLVPLYTIAGSTAVTFVSPSVESFVGSYAQGQEADVLVQGSATIQISNYSTLPQNNLPVYVRTVANATIPGTAVGDFEADADLATSSITIAATTIGSPNVTTSGATGLAPGQFITSPLFPANTYIVSGATTSWVFSQSALATVSAATVALNAYNTALLGTTLDPWIRFSTGQVDSNGIAEVTILKRNAA